MSNIKSLATMAAAATLISSAFGTFDPSSNANMVTYWVSRCHGYWVDRI